MYSNQIGYKNWVNAIQGLEYIDRSVWIWI